MPRVPQIAKQFAFTGEWLPDLDPISIGEENFAILENFRYVDSGIEPIQGYTEINTTALASYYKARAGIQLVSPFTTKSYVLLEVWNVGLTASKIVQNQTDIPDQGDFESTYLYSPTPGAAKGRFGKLPRGIGFSNEQASCIWEGEEMHTGTIFHVASVSGLTPAEPIDYTEILSNSLQTTGNYVASCDHFLIGSTRPLNGAKLYIKTGNDQASTTNVFEWQGSAGFVELDVTADNTDTGPAWAQTGTITWNATGFAEPAYIEGVYLYWYQISIGSGTAEVYQISVSAPFQQIVDIWDGVYREVASFQHDHGSGFEDYTLQVLESTGDLDYYIAAEIGQMDNTMSIRAMFEDRLTAIRIEMVPTKVNTTARTMTIKYWSGTAYTTVGTIYDGTLDDSGGTKTLNQTGVVYWVPPAETSEHTKTEFGVTGYSYEITVSGALSGAAQEDVLIDLVYGIPAQRTMRGHKFPGRFQGHAMWAGDITGKEENKVEYSATNAPDVYNGEDSSDHGKALYFGGAEKLTAGISLYNRFGSRIYETWLAFKEAETYLLDGSGPEDFRIYQISENYGCPAPQTLVTAETGYEVAKDTMRNVAIWLSYRGPVLFDGAVIVPLKGIDLYFDTGLSTCINFEYIANARAWFDSYWQEYHLLIPSGSSQETNNVWVTYDLRRKRWYRRRLHLVLANRDIPYPQLGFIVKDDQGATYPYLITDDGIMHRGEYGNSWNGVSIRHLVRMADHIPSGNIFDITTVHTIRVLAQLPDFNLTTDTICYKINHYLNGGRLKTELDDFDHAKTAYVETHNLINEDGDQLINEDDDNLVGDILNADRYGVYERGLSLNGYSHQFEFYRITEDSDYSGNLRKRLLGFGYMADLDRRDT